MGPSDRDERLDRWYSPPELALLWRCSANTARSRLRLLNDRAGGKLLVEQAGPRRSHVRVRGHALEQVCPGILLRVGGETAPAPSVRELRDLHAEIADLSERVDHTDAWRESATAVLERAFAAG